MRIPILLLLTIPTTIYGKASSSARGSSPARSSASSAKSSSSSASRSPPPPPPRPAPAPPPANVYQNPSYYSNSYQNPAYRNSYAPAPVYVSSPSRGSSNIGASLATGIAAGVATGFLTRKIFGGHDRIYVTQPDRPYQYGGNNYYFGDEYYDNQKNKLPVKCSVPFTQVSANDTAQLYINDNTIVRDVVFGCQTGQYCCEINCCDGNNPSTIGPHIGDANLNYNMVPGGTYPPFPI